MIDVKELYEKIDSYMQKEVTLSGWIRNHRKQKEFGFIDFSDGTCFSHVQLVYDNKLKEFEEILGTIALKKEIAERSRKCEEALFAAEGAEKDLESRFYSAEGNGEAFATLRGALADLKRITATKES